MLKRIFDVTFTFCMLSLISPFLAVIATLIKIDSPGSIFYRCLRLGADGRPFRIFKFRTMVDGAGRCGPTVTFKGDPRITRIGALIRRYKLDEFPQLFNVLRGEMSLIGPRPESLEFLAQYDGKYAPILSQAPGMTGLSWLMLSDTFNEEEMDLGIGWEKTYANELLPRKLDVDLVYIREKTLWLDLQILIFTIHQLINKSISINGGAAPGRRALSQRLGLHECRHK